MNRNFEEEVPHAAGEETLVTYSHTKEEPIDFKPLITESQEGDDSDSLKQTVLLVLTRALNQTKKINEKELTLVQILNAYDDIIREDEKNIQSAPPKIDPSIRQNVYLQLLRFKKQQEEEELRSINEGIQTFENMRSQLNSKLLKSNEGASVLQASSSIGASVKSRTLKEDSQVQKSIYSQIQESLEAKQRKKDVDMVPERLQTNKSSRKNLAPKTHQYVTFSHEDAEKPNAINQQFQKYMNSQGTVEMFNEGSFQSGESRPSNKPGEMSVAELAPSTSTHLKKKKKAAPSKSKESRGSNGRTSNGRTSNGRSAGDKTRLARIKVSPGGGSHVRDSKMSKALRKSSKDPKMKAHRFLSESISAELLPKKRYISLRGGSMSVAKAQAENEKQYKKGLLKKKGLTNTRSHRQLNYRKIQKFPGGSTLGDEEPQAPLRFFVQGSPSAMGGMSVNRSSSYIPPAKSPNRPHLRSKSGQASKGQKSRKAARHSADRHSSQLRSAGQKSSVDSRKRISSAQLKRKIVLGGGSRKKKPDSILMSYDNSGFHHRCSPLKSSFLDKSDLDKSSVRSVSLDKKFFNIQNKSNSSLLDNFLERSHQQVNPRNQDLQSIQNTTEKQLHQLTSFAQNEPIEGGGELINLQIANRGNDLNEGDPYLWKTTQQRDYPQYQEDFPGFTEPRPILKKQSPLKSSTKRNSAKTNTLKQSIQSPEQFSSIPDHLPKLSVTELLAQAKRDEIEEAIPLSRKIEEQLSRSRGASKSRPGSKSRTRSRGSRQRPGSKGSASNSRHGSKDRSQTRNLQFYSNQMSSNSKPASPSYKSDAQNSMETSQTITEHAMPSPIRKTQDFRQRTDYNLRQSECGVLSSTHQGHRRQGDFGSSHLSYSVNPSSLRQGHHTQGRSNASWMNQVPQSAGRSQSNERNQLAVSQRSLPKSSVSRESATPIEVYNMHYVHCLMRKAFESLQANSLARQTHQINSRIAKQRYHRSLMMRGLRSIHTYYLEHFGHRNSKIQATTLANYQTCRKFLTLWMNRYEQEWAANEKIRKVQLKMNFRMKLNVILEWQGAIIQKKLERAQKMTSTKFSEVQILKKGFLVLKFFTKFSLRKRQINHISQEHTQLRLLCKGIAGLKQNVEVNQHKKQKILLSFKVYEFNCQKRAFSLFKGICLEQQRERIFRLKSEEYLRRTLLKKYWDALLIFKLGQAKTKLHNLIAFNYRAQTLQRKLLTKLKISNEVFAELYNEDRINEIASTNLKRRFFAKLLLYKERNKIFPNDLPHAPSFYYLASIWMASTRNHSTLEGQFQTFQLHPPPRQLQRAQMNTLSIGSLSHHGERGLTSVLSGGNLSTLSCSSPRLRKFKKLFAHTQRKVDEYFRVKAFFGLFANCRRMKAFKYTLGLRQKADIFEILHRYSLKQGVKGYKIRIVREKREFSLVHKAFVAMKKFLKQRILCKQMKAHLEAKRVHKLKYKILCSWLQKQIRLSGLRNQKQVGWQMYRRKIFSKFMGQWTRKYQLQQKKKQLQVLKTKFQTENIRNKLFTRWMDRVSQEMKGRIEEIRMQERYETKVIKKVFTFLKFEVLRKKREAVVAFIVSEKQNQLIILRTLDVWRARLQERQEKKELYRQVEDDYNDRLLMKVFAQMREVLEVMKEERIYEMVQRKQANQLAQNMS